MQPYDSVRQPTLILDPARVRANIAYMAEKAARQGARFRPHFKTHQSAEIGEWFRSSGIDAITVSSVRMAEYFARSGWRDITIAFPLNLRELPEVAALAEQVQLGLLVESQAVLTALEQAGLAADVWLKVDTGSGRTGLAWDDPAASLELVNFHRSRKIRLRGLLTHAGHTYRAQNAEEVRRLYQESVERIVHLRDALAASTGERLEVSVGDTPGCAASPHLGLVDEIRPGNFVFYDAQQLSTGVCLPDQVAVVAACPVVARHPERSEVVVYGGAVHLNKDTARFGERAVFGLVSHPLPGGWSEPIQGAWVDRLSQEHGILRMPADVLSQVHEGDVLCLLPAHVCLAVSAMGRFLTTSGENIDTLNVSSCG